MLNFFPLDCLLAAVAVIISAAIRLQLFGSSGNILTTWLPDKDLAFLIQILGLTGLLFGLFNLILGVYKPFESKTWYMLMFRLAFSALLSSLAVFGLLRLILGFWQTKIFGAALFFSILIFAVFIRAIVYLPNRYLPEEPVKRMLKGIARQFNFLQLFLFDLAIIAGIAVLGSTSIYLDAFRETDISQKAASNGLADNFTLTDGVPSQNDVTGLFPFFVEQANGKIHVQIYNTGELDIELVSISTGRGELVASFPADTWIETPLKTGIVLTDFNAQLKVDPEEIMITDLYVDYQYEGDTRVKQAKVNPFQPINEEIFQDTQIRTRDNIAEFEFIKLTSDVLEFNAETIILDRPLYIPPGLRIKLHAGQTIDLKNGAFIISRSPIDVLGTPEKPAQIISSDGTGDGIVFLQAGSNSTLENLLVRNLGEVTSGAYHLTGAITFYESDVIIRDSSFLDNRSEDGLNIVRSKFEISGTTFANTFADAFDADFTEGSFIDCRFEDTGNDALDVSTSQVTITNVTFKDLHDKGVSVGEQSSVILKDLFINGAQIGIGVKDSSTVEAENINISNVLIGYAAYTKKPEFAGGSHINVTGSKLTGNFQFEFLIESKDVLIIDGKQVVPRSKKKEALIIQKIINEEPIT